MYNYNIFIKGIILCPSNYEYAIIINYVLFEPEHNDTVHQIFSGKWYSSIRPTQSGNFQTLAHVH